MKILFIQNRVLFPANTGGKIRTLNILRHLAGWHEITYLCNCQPGDEAFFPQMRQLGVRLNAVMLEKPNWGSLRFNVALAQNLFSSRPFNIARHYDPAVRERARQLLHQDKYDLLICDFLQTALHSVGLRGIPRILFQHNVEAEIFRRHAETSASCVRRRYMTLQWHRMARFESDIGQQFDTVIAVSKQDRVHFERAYGWRHVAAIDTGVDTHYFKPAPVAENEDRVLFLGSMDWLPNQDGVKRFVREVWPRIRDRHPRATFQIVGRNPSAEVLGLASFPGVEVVGTVPDVRPYLAAASAVVVPLLIGGGTRLKIFEAMAMGKAVVSTTIGCEGLPVSAGTHLLVEDSSDTFAQAVSNLLASPATRSALGSAARTLVCQCYGSETVARQFEDICQNIVNRRTANAGYEEYGESRAPRFDRIPVPSPIR